MSHKKIISGMYFGAMALMIAALPLSKYVMSISQFCLAGIFVIDGMDRQKGFDLFRKNSILKNILLFVPYGLYLVFEGICRKFRVFFRRSNMPAIIFASLYLLHVIGLIHTTDFDYAFKDLRIKLPIFLLPLFVSTSEAFSYKKSQYLLILFSAAVLAGTFISTYFLVTEDIQDTRNISRFISHIRFGLLIVYSIFILGFLALKNMEYPVLLRIVFVVTASWLLVYLFISASMTGLAIFFITLFALGLYLFFRKAKFMVRLLVLMALFVSALVLSLYIKNIYNEVYKVYPVDFSNLEKTTARGNYYWHDTQNLQTENGYYVWLYIASEEMEQAWNERSSYDFYGKDDRGQELKFTLMRFLTSKGYRKDAEGVSKLTDEEIELVEKGIASIVYNEKPDFYVRLYKMIWGLKQYRETGNPSGQSALQRLEYWKTSFLILKDNWLWGIGTGDLDKAFDEQYEKMDSKLDDLFRWRSHNQFLAIFIAFGIGGLIWFIIAILYPPLRLRMFSDYFYFIFFVIIITSMITEDTIETQAGVSIFAYFSALLLFGRNWKQKI